MREIKFRQWDADRKVMYHDIGAVEQGWNGCPILKFEENPLMQYTGLKDKNGKEIYERDYLRTATEARILVLWNEKLASFVLAKDGWMYDHYFGEAMDPEDCEVMGNTYEQA